MPENPLSAPMPVPTLDAKGWLTKPEDKAEEILVNYLTADYSQSVLLNQGAVRSFQYTLKNTLADQIALRNAITDDLTALYNPYFDLTYPTVSITLPGKEYNGSDVAYDIGIDLIIVHEKRRFSLGKILEVKNRKLFKVKEFHRI